MDYNRHRASGELLKRCQALVQLAGVLSGNEVFLCASWLEYKCLALIGRNLEV
jgi:hypothetical protein